MAAIGDDGLRGGSFPWPETEARLAALLRRCGDLSVDAARRSFVARDAAGDLLARCTPPAVLPIGAHHDRALRYLDELPASPGRQLVVLLQAGAAALGVWEDDELVAHKVIKKYVVRGKGRAQPTHLKTRGKSRYGSRLRLQNARALLVELNERLHAWWHDEPGPADVVLLSCPVRTIQALWSTRPAPPFPRELARRVPLDVHVPGFDELLRVRRILARGEIELRGEH